MWARYGDTVGSTSILDRGQVFFQYVVKTTEPTIKLSMMHSRVVDTTSISRSVSRQYTSQATGCEITYIVRVGRIALTRSIIHHAAARMEVS